MLRTYRDVRSIDSYAGVADGPDAALGRLRATLGRFFDETSIADGGVRVARGPDGLADAWVVLDGAENFLFVMTPDGAVTTPGEVARLDGGDGACARAFASGANVVRLPALSRRPWPVGALVAAVRRATAAAVPACAFVAVGHRPGLYAAHERALMRAGVRLI